MSLPRAIAGFCVRFLVVFVLLVAPWPGVAAGYASLFARGATVVFGSFGPIRARFTPIADLTPGHLLPGVAPPIATEVLDTRIEVRTRDEPEKLRYMRTSSWQIGYRPTAFLVALVLASPIPWRRRARALLWGLLSINAYVALRLALTLMMGLSVDGGDGAVFPLGSVSKQALEFVSNMIVIEFEGDHVLPAAIWFLVTFRRGDFATVLRGRQDRRRARSGRQA